MIITIPSLILAMTSSEFITASIPYIITVVTSLVTGWASYTVGSRKNKREDFDSILAANAKFREEVRKDLQEANGKIEKLNAALEAKDKEMSEMQVSISDLQNQLMIREINIADLKVEILERDMRLGGLETRMNGLTDNI
jgi:peptidoglycan hydrolase CwlO-like protein